MELYGFRVNEHSPAMEKKIYYCKIINDIRQLTKHISYYPTYRERGSVRAVLEHALEDRAVMLDHIIRYVSEILRSHDIYYYDAARLMDACDMAAGNYVDACMEVQELCCVAAEDLEMQRQLRELRKAGRTRIGAIGQGFSGLAVGMLKAGAVNAATGVLHSAFNAVGNLFSRWEYSDKLDELYDDPRVWKIFHGALQQDCACFPEIIGGILSEEVGPEWAYPFFRERRERMESILLQIAHADIPEDKWPRLLADAVFNVAPYEPSVYFTCAAYLNTDADNLYKAARLFSVEDYYGRVDRRVEEKQREAQEAERRRSGPAEFFGEDLVAAKIFLNRSHADDELYFFVEDRLSPDFNEMIKILLDQRNFLVNGKPEGELFSTADRRKLTFFEFDVPTPLARRRIIAECFAACGAVPRSGEQAFFFVDAAFGKSLQQGTLVTDRALYSSRFPGTPFDYEGIDMLRCGALDSLELVYRGKTLDLKLPQRKKINSLLALACMYFKYGKIEERKV